jgi:voltage-gated sodium channel
MRLEGERSDVLRVFELFCLSVFLLELVLRLLANGRTALKSNWIRFDAFLVFSGLLSLLVLQPLQDEAGIPPDIVRSADMLLLLRLLRFIRVAKILRLLPLFNDMWKMCNGLIKAMNTMFSVVVLMMISIYLFACLGVDLISQSEILAEDQSTRRIVEKKFSSVGGIMLTLMQFADADSIAAVYAPLCMRQPLLALYFGAVWLILTVSLMNVVTAIILETAMAKGRDEAQEQLLEKRRVFTHIRPSLLELFDTLDIDQSGVLTLDEIVLAVKNRTVEFPPEIAESVTPAQMVEAFDFLDTDMSGKIDRKEFVEGVLVMVLSSVPLETAQILHLMRLVFSMVVQTSQNVKRLTEGVAQSMPLGNLQSVKSPGSVS